MSASRIYAVSLLVEVVVDVTELAREGVLSVLLYANDLVLMSETIDNSGVSLRMDGGL